MIRILAIDGGGAKGIIPLTVLSEIEKELDKPIHEVFDMVVGSSVGAIIGGILSADAMTAPALLSTMKKELPKIFKKRIRLPIIQPKYSRQHLNDLFEHYMGSKKMKDCSTKFICTGVDMVDGRTHYFKSWEDKDGELLISEAITRSYAAPLYFGSVVDEKEGAVWLDGGTGSASCPLNQVFVEIMRQRWQGGRVHVLSLGCGEGNYGIPFKKAKKHNNFREVLFYGNPIAGGLARQQVTQEEVSVFGGYAQVSENITMQRLDITDMPGEQDGMDKVKYIPEYERYGQELAEKVNYRFLR